jgi:hypothetical protein
MAEKLTSQDARQGEMVTTIAKYDSVGIAYIVDGEVYNPSGSVWAVKAKDDVFGLVGILQDKGEFYAQAARGKAKVTDAVRDDAILQLFWLD